ncbi:Major facilitator superfamily domain, general substrate transporter [Cordyceps fumosorosea ARSEF 2679]|uniref:Major facilitator superfamily domain, general substrate transporter n=1 Tax=Cordyceps fumosorosea (strain ARSEF 2679) TaxID=1081104 RepID=A0A167YH45_CORFA|nr:Major facilitator superfamily domain, general substrate transporter [Cordyceps fumosorosea ARSEF 2679]OAA66318.1 Major facilitator superfamily domain, general substrate transporter [Cordyceps fumosorosea ARSEF 2679]
MAPSISRHLPFSPSTTALQATTYLLGISLFSISFLVFLNSSVSFVVTDLIGRKHGVGNIVGTLGFADELVALIACPAWGLVSDRLGVRWVATIGYTVIAAALALFVQARNVYPQLLLARILFAVGASAAATMVTAILPSLTNDTGAAKDSKPPVARLSRNPRHSAVFSVESEITITPERYSRSLSRERDGSAPETGPTEARKPSVLAGFVGLFTGCGALLALVLFLPLPVRFGGIDGVTPGEAVAYSFYVVSVVSLLVAVFVFIGLRNLHGEDGKGWRVLLGRRSWYERQLQHQGHEHGQKVVPYVSLLKDSVLLAFKDSRISLGYIGGFVARASTVAISLFIPLYVNTYFIGNGYCTGSPHDSSPELKKECRSAYILSSILTGVAQLMGLLCAPVFGYVSSRKSRVNYPIVIATLFGIVGYLVLPQLKSPEIKNVDGRGGSPAVFLVVTLIGISQIGSIVCSLGILGQGVLAVDLQRTSLRDESGPSLAPDEDESGDDRGPRIRIAADEAAGSRVRLKGSIAGVYSLFGGAAILLLTKLGGFLFDKVNTGAPFYMMAGFNAVLLVASLWVDAARAFARV